MLHHEAYSWVCILASCLARQVWNLTMAILIILEKKGKKEKEKNKKQKLTNSRCQAYRDPENSLGSCAIQVHICVC